MLDDVVTTTLNRADQDGSLSEDAKLLLLQALTGRDLDGALDGGQAAIALPAGRPCAVEDTAAAVPADAQPRRAACSYLTSIAVEGFRGIGCLAELRLKAGPGLTVVAGRNGCGKSSFAEAAELALTRASFRWAARTSVWHESWRNLHHPAPVRVTVKLVEEGVGELTVAAQWADDATDFKAVQVWAQRHGAKRDYGPDPLGWREALDTFRPFLSYDELGAVFGEPSKLHDAIAPMLGLERFDAAVKQLTEHVRALSGPSTQATALSRQLLPRLAASPDPRAGQAAAAMKAKPARLDEVAQLATGAGTPDPHLAMLRELAALTPPDPAGWVTARAAVAEAVRRRDQALADLGAVAMTTTPLLRAALDYHREHGDGPCPVCGAGTLDAGWVRAADAEVAKAGIFQEAVQHAEADLVQAQRSPAATVPPVPPALSRVAAAALPDVATAADAVDAWHVLLVATADPATADTDGLAAFERVADLVARAAGEASAAASAREDAWQPLALDLAHWLSSARQAAAVGAGLTAAKMAEKWLKNNAAQLRNDRLAPLAEQARTIWALLRQESNVDLGEVKLAGASTRRRVELGATVDGQEAGAFGVMSQGELHALALALFLPRATAPDSPFGFIMIDDPVQAMDPAKVDGLAKVLAETAKHRQVIVFTHDDRLPEAVRRLQIDARILEVTRQSDSAVAIGQACDPAERYLSDAKAIARNQPDNAEVVRRVIPALCRWAVEAACKDIYFQRRLKAGTPRAQVEATWNDTHKTSERVALALYDNPRAKLDPWLTTSRRRIALGICSSGAHAGLVGDPAGAVADVEHVVKELAAGAR